MRFQSLFHLVFLSVGLAKESSELYGAVLYADDGYEMIIQEGDCVNLKPDGTPFYQMEVDEDSVCTLYARPDCRTVVKTLTEDTYDMTDIGFKFKSVLCVSA